MRTLGGVDGTQHWMPQDVGTSGPPRVIELAAKPSGSDESGRFRLRPGSLIPGTRLCVEGWLGEGATAVVYRGLHVDLGRALAIKVLRQPNPPAATRERFLAEARRTSELDSEFVVDVIDFGRLEDGRLYYARAFLDGRPLDEILRERPLTVPRSIALLRMACKGLQAAHEHGIVHRDIKPGNMMVISRRKQEHLVIVDFGIATAAGHTAQDVRGTPHTMAPEQIGGGVVDARTDVYALGCCAFEMLTGVPFMDGETVLAILAGHLDDIRPRIGPTHGVPKAVADVVHRCLELRPDDRFDSARELEAALCEAQIAAGLHGGSEHLAPPDVDEPRRTRIANALARSRRRSKARSAVLVALCALVILFVGGGWARARMVAADGDRAGVEQVVAAAHEAAVHSRFVYPPPRSDVPTAYQHVVRLEHWDGPARGFAEERSATLRTELGQALLALGDRSWDQPGAQGRARDYYAQALIFDPNLERARDRVGLTVGELAELRHKASTDSFSMAELETVAAWVPANEEPEPAVMTLAASDVPRPDERMQLQEGMAQVAAATSAASRVVERDPKRARGLVRSANRASHAGRHGEARTLYERALELDDRNADAYAGLADICLEDGQLERALRYAKLAVRRAPYGARHRLRLGDSYHRVARHDEAIAAYRKAAALGSWKARRRLEQLERG
jgi:tetratricopeptide (TPR) repeat protein/tRNA A-37 threonylcarbamoyl transferase component Bud32